MAVTPLRCSSEWEGLSTHYSTDLVGQLEESSINQTDTQAEADDIRQYAHNNNTPTPTATPNTHAYFLHTSATQCICILLFLSCFSVAFRYHHLFTFFFHSLIFSIIHLSPLFVPPTLSGSPCYK